MVAWDICRPLNSHGATMRLTVLGVISQFHGGGLTSHSLLSVSTTDLPVNTTGGFSRFLECPILTSKRENEGPRMLNRTASQ